MKKIHIYSHTHWDYEWYFTASESIIQLVYHMDEVILALKNNVLKTYLLDSQVSILEEYLTMMPENKAIVKKLVEEKRLLIGPWYTQSDELIISGESILRNLFYGIHYAHNLGHCMKIGYLPDSFGQSKDMPKIYNGFSINHALFWRGVPSDVCLQREFIWKSIDGSQVTAYNIRDGYFYGGNVIYNDDVESVEQKILMNTSTTNQLLPLGGDQRYVDFNLQERIKYYNQHTKHNLLYIESDLETFFKNLEKEKLPSIQGEFIDASVSKIHHSIYSSRYDHKVLNDQIERRILYQLEPFMVMQQMIGVTPKLSVLEKLWKKLLLNHAHDSACGCNSDKTNQSILQRLEECDQMSSMLLDYQVRKTSESMENIAINDIFLYNPLPYQRVEVQTLLINTKSNSFSIVDENNNNITFDIIKQTKQYNGSIKKDTSLYKEEDYYYQTTIALPVSIASMSFKKYKVMEDTNNPIYIETNNNRIENKYFSLHLENGILSLFNKKTNQTITDFMYIEDSGDDGDTYDYSYPLHDTIYHLDLKDSSCQSLEGKLYQGLQIKGTWMLPYNLDNCQNNLTNTKVPYVLTIRLHDDKILFELTIENTCIEHRMRAILDSAIQSNCSFADSLFGTVKRDNTPVHMKDWKELGYKEEPTPIYPMLHHVSICNQTSFTSYSKGIKEYEIVNDQYIALTLFRSVCLLGKPDLLRRPGIASGNEFKYIETPLSSLLQPLHFSFACSYEQNYDETTIQKNWILYANDILFYQIQELNRFTNTQKYFVTHPYPYKIEALPATCSLEKTKQAVISSILPINETSYAIRIYNPKKTSIENEIIEIYNAKEVYEVDFLYQNKQLLTIKNNSFYIDKLLPEEIKTYRIIYK